MAETTGQQSSMVAHDITRNPASIWLSPMCDETAHHGEGRTWAVPAPDETCEDCSEPWVEYVRSDLASVSSASAERRPDGRAVPGDARTINGDLHFYRAAGWYPAPTPEPVPATNQAGEVEGAIRIAVWNACRDRGMGQDNATMLVREVLAQPVLTAALATQPATSQEAETMNQKYPVPKNATELSAAVAILLADEPSELKPACKLMPQGFRCTLGTEHLGPCSVLAEANAKDMAGEPLWQLIATADHYKHPSLDLYDPAHAGEYGVSWDGYWNDADGADHPETGGHWVAAVWCNSCSEWHATRINPTHWRLRPAAPEQAS